MKKALVVFLALSMFAVVFTGCSSDDGAVKMGVGSVTSIDKSRDASDEQTAQAQVDTTIAVAAFDKDGKITAVQIDVAQVRVAFDEDMKVTTDRNATIRTKKELEYDYNMKRVSDIDKEWFEQIAAFEEWMIGKTVEEVKNLEVKVVDDAHQHVPDVPELTSTVTITVESYIAALEKAWENAVEYSGIDTIGLGHTISMARSRDASEEVTAQAQVDTTYAGTAFDKDGKVVGTQIDNAQVRIPFDEDGKVANRNAQIKTKKELKYDYNMKRVSDIDKEWFEQIAAFEEWMVGQTIEEIKNLNVKVVDEAHQHVPDVPELTSAVTITVESYIAAVEKAYANRN
ncbi:MAG: hypothetical protein FH749_10375 [Firmicutes bacterium]|nr:hypothetical protein [Bacillota bacterium]